MKLNSISYVPYKLLFLLAITAIYTALVVWLDFLQGPYWWDEKTFWQTSLTFSDRLFPSIEDLRNYDELNTPLPFVIFGALEYLFRQGIFSGRLLNLILSLTMVFAIGWPSQEKGGRAILCIIGLFVCPYYLWLSGRLYTEMIACFWIVLGFVSYVRNRHLLSGIAFILAIASRQYMLAFPVGIAAFEVFSAFKKGGKLNLKILIPVIASLSIVGWFVLFGGLAPAASLEVRQVPDVQRSLLALTPHGGLYFLAVMGLYFIIPELILFGRGFSLRTMLQDRTNYRLYVIILSLLLISFIIFPPTLVAKGGLIKLLKLIPFDFLKVLLLYCLAALTCLRFANLKLETWLLVFNTLIMMKAFPWDRYALPLIVVLWYLKSLYLLDSPKQNSVLRTANSERQTLMEKV